MVKRQIEDGRRWRGGDKNVSRETFCDGENFFVSRRTSDRFYRQRGLILAGKVAEKKESIGGGLGETVGRHRLARPYGQNEVLIESWRLPQKIS